LGQNGKASNEVVQKEISGQASEIIRVYAGNRKERVHLGFVPLLSGRIWKRSKRHSANIKLYPEIQKREDARKVPLAIKRAIDWPGALRRLYSFSAICRGSMAIKISSKGPVLFKQSALASMERLLPY